MIRDLSVLKEFGFTEAETKVYSALVELGESKAGEIIDKSNVQSSVFYRAIHNLTKKGIVSFTKRNNVNYYNISDPETILIYLNQKRNKIENLMPYLKGKYNQKENKESVQIFRGINAMRRMFLSLLKDARKNEEYVFIGGQQHELAKELNIKLFDMVNGILDKNKVKARGIAHKSSQIHRNKTWIFNNMKFVSFSIPTFTVFRNKVIIYDWAEVDNALAFVITSEKIAEQYKNLFKEMWKIAKK